jgi:hypothetical protein
MRVRARVDIIGERRSGWDKMALTNNVLLPVDERWENGGCSRWNIEGGLAMNVGCWMLDIGCWMLDVGCWMLEFG